MNRFLLIVTFIVSVSTSLLAQRKMETLDRGLVAVKVSNGVYASWRIPGDEWFDVTYNLYRDGVKVNSEPLTVSNYTDTKGTASSTYTVKAVVKGVEQAACAPVAVWGQQYLEIPMKNVIKNGADVTSAYSLNDASVADLDGDGVMEVIVKRMNTDFSASNTNYTLFQAYKLDGTLLWTLDMGPNLINSGHVETNCMAFDFDEDGKAEVVFRGTDGTILPDGTVLGNATINYRELYNQEYQCYGDEFLVVMEGATGKLIDQVIFDAKTDGTGNNLARRSAAFWWDGNSKAYGHRANKFHFGAPYLDGRHPSISLVRNCYTNLHAAAYDLINGKLVLRWANWCDDPSSIYYGQGYHNSSVVDVDLDGRDELCQGNMVIDDNGQWLSSTGLGHGDALHFSDMDPYRKGMESFRCLESNPGAVYVDAATNEILFRWVRGNDNGRCMAGNFTDQYPGFELWTTDNKLWSASTSRSADQVVQNGCTGVTMNYRIFWDGDVLHETFNYASSGDANPTYGINPSVYKWGNSKPIFTASGCGTNNHSKGTPCMQADILGDWREEMILRTTDDRALRIYTTVTPTEHRNYSLLYDHQYRQAVYWQMNGYNQPPHISYYMGDEFLLPPPPVCTNGKTEITNTLSSAQNGKFVLMAQTSNTDVAVSGSVQPENVMINTPADYKVSGGTWMGDMRLIKMGLGHLTLTGGTYNYSGNTELWYGETTLESDLPSSPVVMKRFAELNTSATLSKGISMEHGAILRPAGAGVYGSLTTSALTMQGGAVLELDLAVDGKQMDVIKVDNLVLGGANAVGATPVIRFVKSASGTVTPGEYTIISVAKKLEGDVSAATVEGLEGIPHQLTTVGSNVVLIVSAMRSATDVLWSGANGSIWNLNDVKNFVTPAGVTDVFVTGDRVTFDATGAVQTVEVEGNVEPSVVTFDGEKNYTLSGSGKISGATQLVKKGTGTLYINNTNDFTGGVSIEEGTVSISALSDAQNIGALGAFTEESGKFYIGGGATLKTTATLTNATPIQVGEGGIIENNSTFTQNAVISGNTLVKNGTGQLTLAAYTSLKRVELNSGTLKIMPEYQGQTCLGDTVVLRGGTLQFDESSYSYCSSYPAWLVPEGANATARLDSRCNYRGTLHGSGTLTIYVPAYYRTYMMGDWSKFTGTLNATGAKSASYPIVMANTYGMPNATFNIPNAGDVVQLGNDNSAVTGTFTVGKLTGNGTLASGSNSNNTFAAGSLNENFTFNGISNAKLMKVGTGVMTLTANTGSGPIVVSEGSLEVNNSSTSTTSASGTSTIEVLEGATLYGRGYMGNTRVTVRNGGTFRPGRNFAGALTLQGHLNLDEGGVLEFRINNATSSTPNSSITTTGALLLGGTVRILARDDYEPKVGDTFTFWNSKSYNKSYTPTIELPELPAGMKWDTSQLCTKSGTVTVVQDETGIGSLEFDDEVEVTLYALDGKPVTSFSCLYGMVYANAAAAEIPNGIYMIRIHNGENTMVKKYLKR